MNIQPPIHQWKRHKSGKWKGDENANQQNCVWRGNSCDNIGKRFSNNSVINFFRFRFWFLMVLILRETEKWRILVAIGVWNTSSFWVFIIFFFVSMASHDTPHANSFSWWSLRMIISHYWLPNRTSCNHCCRSYCWYSDWFWFTHDVRNIVILFGVRCVLFRDSQTSFLFLSMYLPYLFFTWYILIEKPFCFVNFVKSLFCLRTQQSLLNFWQIYVFWSFHFLKNVM